MGQIIHPYGSSLLSADYPTSPPSMGETDQRKGGGGAWETLLWRKLGENSKVLVNEVTNGSRSTQVHM